jgi:small-conductance mechanosensitive channel
MMHSDQALSSRRLRPGPLRLLLAAALFAIGLFTLAVGKTAADPGEVGGADAEITAPVEVDGNVLFRVRGISALPAAERAARIAAHIVDLADDPAVRSEDLRVVASGDYLTIVASDRPVVTLIEADAELERVSLRALADVYRSRIARAIEEYRTARTPEHLLQSGLRTVLATLALVLAIGLVLWLARRIDTLVERRFHRRIKSLEIQSFEFVRAEHIWGALRALLRAVSTLTILAFGFFYLGYVLALFPWTRAYAHHLLRFALGPLSTIGGAVVTNIPNLIFLAILFFIVRFALRMTHLFFDAVKRGTVNLAGFDPEWADPTYKIARLTVVAFGLIVAYPYIPGSQSAAFKGVSLFLGVVFSLGSSSAISNIIAGYTMTYRRAFRLGDRVKIGETIGDVIEMRLQVTHLRSLKNEEVIVPNSQILNNEIVNFSSLAKEQGLILHTTVGIGYEVPWRQVEAMLLIAVERTPGLLKEPAPFVLHRKLGDFAVEYEVNAHCHDAHAMMPLYTALHRNILDLFNEYGVQIMTPSYESDPQQLKVVPKDQWYTAPAVSGRLEPPRRQATAPAHARGERAGPSVDNVESRGADSQDERTPIK